MPSDIFGPSSVPVAISNDFISSAGKNVLLLITETIRLSAEIAAAEGP